MKIASFDIEATNLNASFGMLLTAGFKPLNGPVKIFQKVGTGNLDKELLAQTIDEMNKYDMLITWYGSRYDLKFIRTRAYKHGLEGRLDPRIKHVDLYDTSKRKLKMHSNRLEAVSEFLLGKTRKTKINPDDWNKAAEGDKAAMKTIVEHNKYDVMDLEDVYNVLVRDIPQIGRI